MQIIITGGTGFIGRALANSLAKEGHHVIVLSRHSGHVSGLDSKIDIAHWDAYSAEGWGHLVNETDVIVNLAGESIAGTGIIPVQWSQGRKRRIAESRSNAGQAIVQAITVATHKPRLLIQASAVGYYGPSDEPEITEDHPAGKDFWQASVSRGKTQRNPLRQWGCGGSFFAQDLSSVRRVVY